MIPFKKHLVPSLLVTLIGLMQYSCVFMDPFANSSISPVRTFALSSTSITGGIFTSLDNTPHLRWEALPSNAVHLYVIMQNITSATTSTTQNHFAYEVPTNITEIAEGELDKISINLMITHARGIAQNPTDQNTYEITIYATITEFQNNAAQTSNAIKLELEAIQIAKTSIRGMY